MVHFPKKDPYIVIANRTVNFKCGNDPGAQILISLCSGMRIPPDMPGQIVGMLRKEWNDADALTFEDFTKKNADSVRLLDDFSTPWKHGFSASDPPQSTDKAASSDMDIYFSRVGFNPAATEAIVYALTISRMDRVSTEGDYFLFRLDAEGWKPHGRLTYMEHRPDQSDWIVVNPDGSK